MVGDQGRVIAVDVQQKMLDVLARRAERAKVAERIRVHRCEPDSIGFEGIVDLALAFYSLHEVPDQRQLLSEIRGCLDFDGQLLVAEPIGHVRANDFEAMVSHAKQVGFEVVHRPGIRLSRAIVLRKVQFEA
jgi:ubiquinone/menaquinone biosynthesis C-methylase UbiE